jgi:hypothetical protein
LQSTGTAFQGRKEKVGNHCWFYGFGMFYEEKVRAKFDSKDEFRW